jgi:hypothetical protein
MNHQTILLEDDNYDLDDELPAELDFERLRFVRRGPKPKSLTVTLPPDVAEFFKTPEAVNDALRQLMERKRNTPA